MGLCGNLTPPAEAPAEASTIKWARETVNTLSPEEIYGVFCLIIEKIIVVAYAVQILNFHSTLSLQCLQVDLSFPLSRNGERLHVCLYLIVTTVFTNIQIITHNLAGSLIQL